MAGSSNRHAFSGAVRPGWRKGRSFGLTALVATVVASAMWLPGSASANKETSAKSRFHGPYVPGQLLVRFAPGVSPQSVNARLGAQTVRSYHIVPNLQLVRLPKSMSVTSGVAAYAGQSGVMYAEPNFISHLDDTTPNDTSFPLQWDWLNTGQIGGTPGDDIDATKAWDLTTGSSSVAVGIVDSGVQLSPHIHTDLVDNIWSNTAECNGVPGVDDEGDGYIDDCHGIDAINHDSDPNDDTGHGTHLAGTIGAMTNNNLGVAGMNWHVTMVPCKSHDETGNGTNDSLLECLQFMSDWKDRGLNIVATNNSYGGCLEACDYSQSLYDAIKNQMDHGILFVASAGNDSANNDTTLKYPTDYYLPNVIGVAASTNIDSMASFSNYGVHSVYLGAPGQSVYSTFYLPTDGYIYLSGTSMASPHVAGLAALIEANDPSLDWRAIKNLLLAGGEVIPAMQGKTVTGRRLNAYGSLTCNNVPVFGPLRPLPSPTGGTQPVSALNINCADGAGGVSVTITPGNTRLVLKDNGRQSDLAPGDGIYSASWTPCAAPPYTLSYSNGATDTVTVTGLTPCIRANPPSGPPGSNVQIRGKGFAANETVTISFDGTMVGTANTNADGKFIRTITVPNGASQGRHRITAIGATSALTTEVAFEVS
jgi:subtilisin family serine protease